MPRRREISKDKLAKGANEGGAATRSQSNSHCLEAEDCEKGKKHRLARRDTGSEESKAACAFMWNGRLGVSSHSDALACARGPACSCKRRKRHSTLLYGGRSSNSAPRPEVSLALKLFALRALDIWRHQLAHLRVVGLVSAPARLDDGQTPALISQTRDRS